MKPITVLCIGGGTGLYSLLSGIKSFPSDLVKLKAVVTTLDNGGSSGKLITQFGVLPPGDIRNCLIALSEESRLLKDLFQYRFDKGVDNHSFGNLFLTALNEVTGSFDKAIKEASKILRVKGEVIPVSLKHNVLSACMSDGSIVDGESEIGSHDKTIESINLKYKGEVNPRACEIARNADYIIFGPGSLYTSIIPNLLFDDFRYAIANNLNAKKVLITNVMTEPGETSGFKLSNFITEVEKYLASPIDIVLANNNIPSPEVLELYKKENKHPVYIDIESSTTKQLIYDDFIDHEEVVRHDPSKLALCILNILYKQKIFKQKKSIKND